MCSHIRMNLGSPPRMLRTTSIRCTSPSRYVAVPRFARTTVSSPPATRISTTARRRGQGDRHQQAATSAHRVVGIVAVRVPDERLGVLHAAMVTVGGNLHPKM